MLGRRGRTKGTRESDERSSQGQDSGRGAGATCPETVSECAVRCVGTWHGCRDSCRGPYNKGRSRSEVSQDNDPSVKYSRAGGSSGCNKVASRPSFGHQWSVLRGPSPPRPDRPHEGIPRDGTSVVVSSSCPVRGSGSEGSRLRRSLPTPSDSRGPSGVGRRPPTTTGSPDPGRGGAGTLTRPTTPPGRRRPAATGGPGASSTASVAGCTGPTR